MEQWQHSRRAAGRGDSVTRVMAALALLSALAGAAEAQRGAIRPIRLLTVAQLPASNQETARPYIVTDGATTGDCTVGGGSTVVWCAWTGAAYEVIEDGAGGTDTSAATECSGTTTYLDGEGGCDDISGVYAAAAHASSHSDGGADEVSVEDLATGCGDGEGVVGSSGGLPCTDLATQAEMDALDTTGDDLSDNQVGDLSDVSEASADSGDALVSDGAGSWSPVDVLTPAEAAAAYCALTGCTLTGNLSMGTGGGSGLLASGYDLSIKSGGNGYLYLDPSSSGILFLGTASDANIVALRRDLVVTDGKHLEWSDVGLERSAAGVLGVTDGSTGRGDLEADDGDFAGTLAASRLEQSVSGFGSAYAMLIEQLLSSGYAGINFETTAGLIGQFLATGPTFSAGAFLPDELALAAEGTSTDIHLAAIGSGGKIRFTTGGNSAAYQRFVLDENGDADFSDDVTIGGSLDLGDPGTKPTCDSSVRGQFHYDEGGAGVADTVEICMKDSGDAYAWETVATP